MVADAEQESQARAVDRLIYFSDAVVAIAITLLAIDLPVPTGHTAAELLSSARQNSGHYAAFLISFLAIAAAWSHHHDIFRYARRMDSFLRQLNTGWLMLIVLNPFATKLLTGQPNATLGAHALRFGCYALLQALLSGILLAMLQHMITHGQVPGIPGPVVADATWQSYSLVLAFGLSIPVFFAVSYGWLVWIVVPIVMQRIYRLRHPKRPPEAG